MSIGKTLLCSAWLPAGIAVAFVAGDFDTGPSTDSPLALVHTFLLMSLLMWPLGIPLAFAVRTLLRYSKPLAWCVAAAGAPLSVWMFFLSVPLPSFANATVVGLLAWLLAGCVALANRAFERPL